MEYYGTVGEDDDVYDENGVLCEQGAIYSTLVVNGVAGYGYYEGTSMACPHVSGVAALGLSYAKQQHRHFTWEEFKQLMYDSARDIDSYFVGEKLFYMHHTSPGATPIKMNLEEYKGKMGRLVDAGSLLKAVDGSGRDMRLPNLYLAPATTMTIDLGDYLATEAQSVEVNNSNIAAVSLSDNMLTVNAIAEGQTALTIICSDGSKHYSTITVRKGANDNGVL